MRDRVAVKPRKQSVANPFIHLQHLEGEMWNQKTSKQQKIPHWALLAAAGTSGDTPQQHRPRRAAAP